MEYKYVGLFKVEKIKYKVISPYTTKMFVYILKPM